MLEWIQHAEEEYMDAILYLEKLKNEYIKHTTSVERVIHNGTILGCPIKYIS